jgi:hypothetical protein
MFHTPVITSTAKAAQATWLKRRAAARGTSAPNRRSTRDRGGQGRLAAHPNGGGEDM